MFQAGAFGQAVYLASTGVVSAKPGLLIGYLPATSTSGSIALHDNASAASGDNFIHTTPVTAGVFVPIPVGVSNGVYATLTNTTGTFIFSPAL